MIRKVLPLLLIGALMAWGCEDEGEADWSDRELVEEKEVEVRGVTVELTLPEGMKADGHTDTNKAWVADKGDYFSEPRIRLGSMTAPASLEAAIDQAEATASPDDLVFAREEEVEGGYDLTYHNEDKTQVSAIAWRNAEDEEEAAEDEPDWVEGGGPQAVRCTASQARDDGVPNFEATKAWLESVCGTMTVR